MHVPDGHEREPERSHAWWYSNRRRPKPDMRLLKTLLWIQMGLKVDCSDVG